ncbi:hypothetical protein Btru_063888 [Bulinus truncatus]|nr:hypothetical protein Btru_063888 [Bulinus truncatus]
MANRYLILWTKPLTEQGIFLIIPPKLHMYLTMGERWSSRSAKKTTNRMELTGTFISSVGELKEAINNTDKLVIVYFYTEWSPPCRKIRFEFMQAELRNPDVIYLAANMDRAKSVAGKLGVTLEDIPAIVVFRHGRQIHTATMITAEEFGRMDYAVPPGDGGAEEAQRENPEHIRK